jgi:hypothetical protein
MGGKTGFFIEVGAYNGIESSNTYILEQLGWEGVCVLNVILDFIENW